MRKLSAIAGIINRTKLEFKFFIWVKSLQKSRGDDNQREDRFANGKTRYKSVREEMVDLDHLHRVRDFEYSSVGRVFHHYQCGVEILPCQCQCRGLDSDVF